jgi:Cytochrome P450
MDPTDWNEPTSFKPERFLDEHGRIITMQKEKVIPFSLGTRTFVMMNNRRRLAGVTIYLFGHASETR